MNFEDDIRQHVLSELPHQPNQAAELAGLPVSKLFVIYRNWCSRLVTARPRRVHRSRALLANPLYHSADVGLLIDKLEVGADVTAHLSRDIREGYRIGTRHRPDLDLMLNDWGVHHLHPSSEIGRDGFVRRHGSVLFAAFKADDAYLIDIMQHGDWNRQHVLEIMVREWPQAQLMLRIRGAIPQERKLTESERKTLRSNHTNAFFEIDGALYASRTMGLSGAGTSTIHTLGVNRMLRSLEVFRSLLDDEEDPIGAEWAKHGATMPEDPEFRLVFPDEKNYGVLETKTGTLMPLGVFA